MNHSLFWKNLCPPKVRRCHGLCCAPPREAEIADLPFRLSQDFAPPSGEVLQYITRDFGSLDALVKKFSATAVGVQGSGWGVRLKAFLCLDTQLTYA